MRRSEWVSPRIPEYRGVELNGPFSPLQQLVGVGKSFELRLADFGLSDRTGEDSGEKED